MQPFYPCLVRLLHCKCVFLLSVITSPACLWAKQPSDIHGDACVRRIPLYVILTVSCVTAGQGPHDAVSIWTLRDTAAAAAGTPHTMVHVNHTPASDSPYPHITFQTIN
jgi:hypothetical protein